MSFMRYQEKEKEDDVGECNERKTELRDIRSFNTIARVLMDLRSAFDDFGIKEIRNLIKLFRLRQRRTA